MLNAIYQRAFPIARAILPRALRSKLGGFVGRLEHILVPRSVFKNVPDLMNAPALLSAEEFAEGPILHINNALAWGGVERQIVNTLLGLQARQHRKLGLLCLRLSEGGEYAFYRDALNDFRGELRDIRNLAWAMTALRSTFNRVELDAAARIFAWTPRDVQERIWRLLAEFTALRPAAVHAWQDGLSIEAAYAATLAGVPVIIVSSRNMAPVHFAYGRPYMRPAYRAIAASPRITMLANSEAGAQDYASWLGLDTARFRVLRNGVNTADVQPLTSAEAAARRTALGIPASAQIVGSVFRFYDEKRPLLWMQTAGLVANQTRDVHFVIFGAGPLRDAARAFADHHGFGMRLHTPGAATDGARAISMFDVFVLTSKFEGTPNVILEASLLGVPIVATPAGGAAETVELGQTGWIESDAAGLANRIVRVLNDPTARGRCAIRGPAFIAARFGLERMIEETRALYRQADHLNVQR